MRAPNKNTALYTPTAIRRALCWCYVPMLLLIISCASPEIYFAREQAREKAYLKRIASDTIARAPYVAPIAPYYAQPYYSTPWYYGVNRSYYNGSVRYVVPYRASKRIVKRRINRKTRTYGNRNRSNNSYHSRSSTNRSSNKKATIRRTEVKRIKNQNQKQK